MSHQLLENLEALLITNPTNIRYLTGFAGVSEKEREAYLLLTGQKRYLLTSSLYRQSVRLTNCTFIELSIEKRFATQLAALVRRGRLGFEEKNLTVAEFEKLQKELPTVSLEGTTDRVETLRQIKRPDEIADIKAACRIGDECFTFIIKEIKPGVTESEIAWKIESFIRKKGTQVSFAPIVAFGPNSSMPHYSPSDDCRLKTDDVLLLDFGARVNGYCSDMTRVMFIGKPKATWMRAYESVLRAQNEAIRAILKGERSGAKLDAIARRRVSYPHGLGHNVGLDIHESPRLSIKKDAMLKPGMVFSVEPGIYLPGRYGIRIEDLVHLTEDGAEILTKAPKEILCL